MMNNQVLTTPSAPVRPAWQQFWFWFVIGLPLLAVVASLTSVFLALQHQDRPVIANAYDEGQAINQDLALEAFAKQAGIQAQLSTDPLTHVLIIHLQSTQPLAASTLLGDLRGGLRLNISHPEDPDQDFSPALRPTGTDTFQAILPDNIKGLRYIELKTTRWKLIKESSFPITQMTLQSS